MCIQAQILVPRLAFLLLILWVAGVPTARAQSGDEESPNEAKNLVYAELGGSALLGGSVTYARILSAHWKARIGGVYGIGYCGPTAGIVHTRRVSEQEPGRALIEMGMGVTAAQPLYDVPFNLSPDGEDPGIVAFSQMGGSFHPSDGGVFIRGSLIPVLWSSESQSVELSLGGIGFAVGVAF